MSDLIYSADPGLIIGFHGCEQITLNKVITGKTMLRTSQNLHDWLGTGFYFWQNNYDRALDFATNPPGKSKYKKPAVLGGVLDLGHCLDLSDKRWIDLIRLSYETLKQSALSEGSNLPKNKTTKSSKDKVLRELDCAVIENIHKVNMSLGEPPFDSVRGVFIEGESVYEGAGFHAKTHVQICIRNPNCIKGLFLPRRQVKWP